MHRHFSQRLEKLIISCVVFTLIFGAYVSSREVVAISDPIWSIYIAMSVVREGDTDLDEYDEVLAENQYYGVDLVDGHLHSFFPLGASWMAVPLVYLVDRISYEFLSIDWYERLQTSKAGVAVDLELFIASFFVALACVVMYWICDLCLDSKRALILVLIFAFCSSAWSTASRSLWQHGPSILMLSLSFYLVLLAKDKPSRVQFAGLFLAYAYVIRPTNSIPIFFITIYVFIRFRRYFLRYVLWASLIAIPFFLFNLQLYNTLLSPYYLPQRLGSNSYFWSALAGNLVSPSRGLFVYSPVFVFALYGIFLKVKNGQFGPLDGFVVTILFFHWVAISSVLPWWGGSSFGPRFFTDMLPYLTYLLIPVVARLRISKAIQDLILVSVFALSVLFSFFVHYRGVTNFNAAIRWNYQADFPEDLWDWSDPQVWRDLRPPKLRVGAHSLQIIRSQVVDPLQTVNVRISNTGDGLVNWSVRVPRRVEMVGQATPVQSASSSDVAFRVSTVGYDPGLHSLGGIYISATRPNGKHIAGSPVVIPLTLLVQARDADEVLPLTALGSYRVFLPLMMNRYPDLLTLPADITVSGRSQKASAEQIYAVHGPGWYDLEHFDVYAWRWAASPSEIYVYSPSKQRIVMEFLPTNVYDKTGASNGQGVMYVTANDGESIVCPISVEQIAQLDVNLESGWNVIAFELAAGNFRPGEIDPGNGDMRELSFALRYINLVP